MPWIRWNSPVEVQHPGSGPRLHRDGTPAVFGFAEWNGRSLTDNAPDVMFSIAANTPIRLGIGRESVTSKPSTKFPYVPAAA